MTLIYLALIMPGLIVGYWLFIRPFLRALPQLKDFYATADGFWEKVWALCGNSAVIAWGYVLQAIGWTLQWIDPIAGMLGDPDFRNTIMETLGANPQILGYVLMAISAITIAARLRSVTKGDE